MDLSKSVHTVHSYIPISALLDPIIFALFIQRLKIVGQRFGRLRAHKIVGTIVGM